MKSKVRGRSISPSDVEVLNISSHGVWLSVLATEYFLPFFSYPWFRRATVSQIQNVELLSGRHLHWPDLDVDLEVESLVNPEKYPLIFRK